MVRFVGRFNDSDPIDWEAKFPHRELTRNGVTCVFGGTGYQDVLAVLDDVRHDYVAKVRDGGVWVWHTEATMPKNYRDCYDLVFSHIRRPDDSRFIVAPPVLDWWLGKSFDELAALSPPEKPYPMSAVASTKTGIAGHRLRNDFIARVERELPEIDVFGRGRQREVDDKWDSIAPYRFTIAIENSSSPDYWTEKLTDAFMAWTVPLYFGAPNIIDYFPEDSFIWLPIDDPDRAMAIIRQTLEDDNWESRLAAVGEARKRILERWCLAEQVTRNVMSREATLRAAPFRKVRVTGRRVWRNGWIRDAGLKENIRVHSRAAVRRISRRLKRGRPMN